MVSMNVSVEIEDLGYDSLIERLSSLDGRFADAGYMEEETHEASGESIIDIAIWNNYGTFGEDNSWHIPPRRFMEASLNKKGLGSVNNAVERALDKIYNGEHPKQAMETIAKVMSVNISVVIEMFNRPGNAESTIAIKGFDNPLIETGELQNKVQHKTGQK